ncbi:hypothetical protein LCGC14_1172720 [marine sediment metagenome]|uniref:Disease resistance R13L4/SHOC-2-like LRR domain-containing protein n=1 Tax=marine sediment metagenome TaxID=412755 RepID=A0A0F9P7F7_9ZZZZ|nr:leucine-rich repeat domain-containing protein [bacterium]
MQEFKVNDYITLKLENKKTNIYVKGEFFEQCTSLLVNIPAEGIDSYNEFESIDEIIKKLGRTGNRQLGVEYKLTPETEFFGHCSNLQAWVEYNYDTRILDSELAFPLLKELAKLGDYIARKVFKEEISKRLASGFPSVITYLIEEGYDSYLSREEYLFSLLKIRDAEVLLDLERIIGCQFQVKNNLDDFREIDECDRIEIKFNNIIGITLSCEELTNDIIKPIKKLRYLRKLYLYAGRLKMFEELLPSIKKLDDLRIFCDEINKVPKTIGILTNLKILVISGKIAQSIPPSIRHLKSLKVLSLRDNRLITLPKSIGSLDSLERLDLVHNPLNILVETIKNLHSLKELVLDKKQAGEERNTKIIDFLKKKGVKITII